MDITYNLETLTGKHGGLLEVVESIISDGRLILIMTDEDVLQRRAAKRRFLSADLAARASDDECKRRSFRVDQGKP